MLRRLVFIVCFLPALLLDGMIDVVLWVITGKLEYRKLFFERLFDLTKEKE